MCCVMYSTGTVCEGHRVPSIVDKANGYEGLHNVWGVQYVPRVMFEKLWPWGHVLEVASPNGVEGALISCIYRFGTMTV